MVKVYKLQTGYKIQSINTEAGKVVLTSDKGATVKITIPDIHISSDAKNAYLDGHSSAHALYHKHPYFLYTIITVESLFLLLKVAIKLKYNVW